MAFVGKNSKAIELSISDGIVYGANTFFLTRVAPVYGAMIKCHGASKTRVQGRL
jgi:hypothetical protein